MSPNVFLSHFSAVACVSKRKRYESMSSVLSLNAGSLGNVGL